MVDPLNFKTLMKVVPSSAFVFVRFDKAGAWLSVPKTAGCSPDGPALSGTKARAPTAVAGGVLPPHLITDAFGSGFSGLKRGVKSGHKSAEKRSG